MKIDLELAYFEACREMLDRGDTNAALRWLDHDDLTVPDSRFTRERRVLRVLALMQAGDVTRARRLFDALLKDYPTLQIPAELEPLTSRPPRR